MLQMFYQTISKGNFSKLCHVFITMTNTNQLINFFIQIVFTVYLLPTRLFTLQTKGKQYKSYSFQKHKTFQLNTRQ